MKINKKIEIEILLFQYRLKLKEGNLKLANEINLISFYTDRILKICNKK